MIGAPAFSIDNSPIGRPTPRLGGDANCGTCFRSCSLARISCPADDVARLPLLRDGRRCAVIREAELVAGVGFSGAPASRTSHPGRRFEMA